MKVSVDLPTFKYSINLRGVFFKIGKKIIDITVILYFCQQL